MRDLPYSNRIEPYLEAISGCDAFFVADRPYGKIINYRQMGADVFPDPATAPDARTAYLWGLRRQCRGLVFDLAGNVISPGFEKFFNISEREETLADNVDWTRPHIIFEKLDGSLVRPIPMQDGGYRLGTKMGLTSVAEQPENWLKNHTKYDLFITDLLARGLVPLFEWCSRKQKIVCDYPEDRLVLLAVRDVKDGSYLPLNMMLELAVEYGVEVVRRYPGTLASMQHLMAEMQDLQDQEGWVICFENGYRLKVKGPWYVAIHRAKEGILRENGVIEMMLDEKLDDVKGFLFVEDRDALEQFETEFWRGISLKAVAWQAAFDVIKQVYGDDRKAFALGAAQNMEAFQRQAMFRAWEDAQFDWREAVLDTVRRNISTGVKTEAARHLWGGARWDGSPMMGDE